MKKILAMLLILVLSLSIIGCGKKDEKKESTNGTTNEASSDTSKDSSNESSENTTKETVTIWAWNKNFNIAAMEEAKKVYAEINPNVEIDIVEFGKSDIEKKLHTNLASNMTEGLPEIVLITDYNAQQYIQSYPEGFSDLTGKIDHDQFAEYKVNLMTTNGQIYGVPFDTGAVGFFFRTDYLEEAGYTEADLTNITWDKFIEIGQAVKEKTGKYMLTINPNDDSFIKIMLQSAGVWYTDENGNPTIENNEVLKEALNIQKQFIDTGIAKVTSGWSEFVGAFNGGEVASVVTGAWIMPSIVSEASQSGLWKAVPCPRLDIDGSINASSQGGSSWYVLADSKGKDAAIDFLNATFGSSKEFYQTILDQNNVIATFLPSKEGDAYEKELEFFNGQAVYQDVVTWMEEIPNVNYGLYTAESGNLVMAEFVKILEGKSIDDALISIQEQLESQIQ